MSTAPTARKPIQSRTPSSSNIKPSTLTKSTVASRSNSKIDTKSPTSDAFKMPAKKTPPKKAATAAAADLFSSPAPAPGRQDDPFAHFPAEHGAGGVDQPIPQASKPADDCSAVTSEPIRHHGDVVWAQVEAHFPLWPACVFDVDKLPTDIQVPKSSSKMKKVPVYLYGKNDFDLCATTMLRDFDEWLEDMRHQEIGEELIGVYQKGIALAESDNRKPVEERLSCLWQRQHSPAPSPAMRAASFSPVSSPLRSSGTPGSTPEARSDRVFFPETGVPPTPFTAAMDEVLGLAPTSDEPVHGIALGISELDKNEQENEAHFTASTGEAELQPELSAAESSSLAIGASGGEMHVLEAPSLQPPASMEESEWDRLSDVPLDTPITTALQTSSAVCTPSEAEGLSSAFAMPPAPSSAPFPEASIAAPPLPPSAVPATSAKIRRQMSGDASSLFGSSHADPFQTFSSGAPPLFSTAPPAAAADLFARSASADEGFPPPAAPPASLPPPPFPRTHTGTADVAAAELFGSSPAVHDVPAPVDLPHEPPQRPIDSTQAAPAVSHFVDAAPAASSTSTDAAGGFPAEVEPVELSPPLEPDHDQHAVQASAPTLTIEVAAEAAEAPQGPITRAESDFHRAPASSLFNAAPLDAPPTPSPREQSEPPTSKPAEEPRQPTIDIPTPATSSSAAPTPTSATASVTRFKGRAPVVMSCSPFDSSPAPGSDIKSLFPPAPKAVGVPGSHSSSTSAAAAAFGAPVATGSTPLPSAASHAVPGGLPVAATAAAAASLFGSGPSFSSAAAAHSVFDSAPAPLAMRSTASTHAAANVFAGASPSPLVKPKKAQPTAIDVFSSTAPMSSPGAFQDGDPFSPPPPPGVKMPPPKPPAPAPSVAPPSGGGTPSAGPPASSTSKGKPRQPVPPQGNVVPTPHGFISLPPAPSTDANAAASGIAAAANSAAIPPLPAMRGTSGSEALVPTKKLTAFVTGEAVPSPVAPVSAPPAVPAVTPAPAPASAPKYTGGRYIKPAGASVTFGFAGKTLVCLPVLSTCPPVYAPIGQRPEARVFRLGMRSGPMKVYRTLDLIETDTAKREIAQFKKLLSAEGVHLDASRAQQLINDIATSGYTSGPSEQLLWKVLELYLAHRGLCSSGTSPSAPPSSTGSSTAPTSCATSVERILADLLLASAAVDAPASGGKPPVGTATSATAAAAAAGGSASALDSAHYLHLESLLLRGDKASALDHCVAVQDWSFALLLGAVSGQERLQEVVRLFNAAVVPSDTALQLLTLLYSNQAQSTVAFAGKAQFASASSSSGNAGFLRRWRQTLAAIVANKPTDWVDLLQTLGARLLAEAGDVHAAHVCFLCAGLLPSNTAETEGRGFLLLGARGPTQRYMADLASIAGLRMCEVIECVLSRAGSSSSGSSSAASTAASSLSGMFAWSKSTSSSSPATASNPAGPAQTAALNKLRLSLCPLKIRFASLLLDMGLVEQARGYIEEALQLGREVGVQEESMGKGGLSKALHNAVLELNHRLGGGGGKKEAEGAKNAASSTSTTSLWGLVSTLKDLVDAPDTRPAAAPAPAPAPATAGGPPSSRSTYPAHPAGPPTAGRPPSASSTPAVPRAPPSAPSFPNAAPLPPGMTPAYPFAMPASALPSVSSSSTDNAGGGEFVEVDLDGPSSMPPMPYPNAYPQPPQRMQAATSAQPPAAMATPTATTTPRPHSFNPAAMAAVAAASAAGASGGGLSHSSSSSGWFVGTPPSSTPPTSSTSLPDVNSSIASMRASAVADLSVVTQAVAPSSSAHTTAATASSKPPSSPAAHQESVASQSSAAAAAAPSGPGIVSSVRKGIISWLYPDARDASENIGGKLEAYYDKALGRWVFPGEDPAADNPSLKPPPISGPPSSNASAGSATGPPSLSGGGGNGGSSSGPPSMAGPPLPSSSSSAGVADLAADPLAALMAPPPIRRGPPSSTFGVGGGGGGGVNGGLPPMPSMASPFGLAMPPTSSDGSAPPISTYKVWTPPVTTPAASTPPALPSADSSANMENLQQQH